MTHYESAQSARSKDEQAIEQILKLDPVGLYTTVREKRISMCGCFPCVALLEACRRLGARQAKLVKYANSGDITGDYRNVVGYAGLVVY
jgi:AmmeMemoRadiSam system protein B